MVPGGDPTPDVIKMMDKAGLDGRLLTFKGPFSKGVLTVREKLLVQFKEYITQERRAAFQAGAQSAAQQKQISEEEISHGSS